MNNHSREKGAIMVEASIYVPIVLCVVMMMIYYAIFAMQQYMLMYEAERASIIIAREEAYLGYENFQMGQNNQIDFDWGDSGQPSADQVEAYYNEYNNKVSHIYREIGSVITAIGWSDPSAASEERLTGAGRETVFLALGTVGDADISIDRGIFGTKVVVSIEHSFPTPGVLRFVGLDERLAIKSSAYTFSVNGTNMVRNVDFACDLVTYILDKFGLGDEVSGFVEKMNLVLDKIL